MIPSIKITSGFAVLDVKEGRQDLTRHFAKLPRGSAVPQHLRIPVTITGFINDIHSDDDGVSREFGVAVTSVTTDSGDLA